jgi:hypothetical protein
MEACSNAPPSRFSSQRPPSKGASLVGIFLHQNFSFFLHTFQNRSYRLFGNFWHIFAFVFLGSYAAGGAHASDLEAHLIFASICTPSSPAVLVRPHSCDQFKRNTRTHSILQKSSVASLPAGRQVASSRSRTGCRLRSPWKRSEGADQRVSPLSHLCRTSVVESW